MQKFVKVMRKKDGFIDEWPEKNTKDEKLMRDYGYIIYHEPELKQFKASDEVMDELQSDNVEVKKRGRKPQN